MRKMRSDRLTELGELQLQVLDALNRIGEGTVYEVLDRFAEEQRPRYTTVLTVLRSLEKKGLVSHRTEGRTYIFRPGTEARHVRSQVLRDVLERVFRGSHRELVLSLLDGSEVTPEVLAELRQLIAEKEREGADG
jgi:BlaI family penicillinase repressor